MATDLLSALRDYLVAQGIVRKPSVAGSLPPLWLEPQTGTPAPGEGNNPTEVGSDLVLGAFLTGGIAPARFESWWRQPIVDIRLRGKSVQTIQSTELAMSKALIDKVDWTMGGLYLVEAEQWRALQRLGSDEQGFEFVVSYIFQAYRP